MVAFVLGRPTLVLDSSFFCFLPCFLSLTSAVVSFLDVFFAWVFGSSVFCLRMVAGCFDVVLLRVASSLLVSGVYNKLRLGNKL